MTRVAVLGSTGSIGTQTLDILAARPDRYEVAALGAASSVDLLVEQVERFRPPVVAIADASLAAGLADRVPAGTEVLAGGSALAEAALTAGVVVNGVVGFAGLPVTLAALESGRRLCLANKESLIAAGPVVREARATPGAELLPVDSEHCAVHQCLRGDDGGDAVDRVVLTASGGPFRGRSSEELVDVTIEDALDHPTWSMGPKVTVDSSTLMNKGLEVIEAHELFDVDYDRIDVVVHPQSVVHSMVSFTDGTTMAQLSRPDMRLCIGYALAYPDRLDLPFGTIDWSEASRLDFEPPDRESFPCLDLAFAAGRLGATAPAWLNAANEVAVEAFLEGRLPWVGIAEVLTDVLEDWPGLAADSIEAVLDADERAREVTSARLAGRP
ncbi:MAG: 1-deoxy-D-xylulose-5-phosphate reductoisomerase [Acidimicrobiales bacterium]|jgi:1-deoxy-D-xylulose-5-phosphate reductoisomerase|nr:1-deoxy-D-xylulose-5-phosphate reductoisomerase [Actinomycetes bacterium]MDP6105717.1 1-deoxy-D-xylulose-5-phosphate reductoisomerase [Acidimicrobiales bacterium]MDP6241623.1 1-deoxy-D-xylulose-5-phosphate reductoisomerase [Acidimicrobiales bacterium]MDP7125389.1 1-deoxy-D-xylulose-5-phosphate reductoisomerase [Acidimicrobiales bacterium]MDP7352531.1 1-deoxy-D-xylulose-5-phosphate reductoisomerase [Acidimicrobiales bacterium]|tara:strand:- start:4551 stop:5702 length:1152 start_codon:yes stop_codon:yes gene_type:complete